MLPQGTYSPRSSTSVGAAMAVAARRATAAKNFMLKELGGVGPDKDKGLEGALVLLE